MYRLVCELVDSNPNDHRQWNATGRLKMNASVPNNRWASPSHGGNALGILILS